MHTLLDDIGPEQLAVKQVRAAAAFWAVGNTAFARLATYARLLTASVQG